MVKVLGALLMAERRDGLQRQWTVGEMTVLRTGQSSHPMRFSNRVGVPSAQGGTESVRTGLMVKGNLKETNSPDSVPPCADGTPPCC